MIHKVKAQHALECALRDGYLHAFVANAFADAAATQGVQLYRDRGAEEARAGRCVSGADASEDLVLEVVELSLGEG